MHHTLAGGTFLHERSNHIWSSINNFRCLPCVYKQSQIYRNTQGLPPSDPTNLSHILLLPLRHRLPQPRPHSPQGHGHSMAHSSRQYSSSLQCTLSVHPLMDRGTTYSPSLKMRIQKGYGVCSTRTETQRIQSGSQVRGYSHHRLLTIYSVPGT